MSAAVGLAVAGTAELMVTTLNPDSGNVAASGRCADELGYAPTLSETMPADCMQALGMGFFSYTQDSKTYYLLPSRDMMIASTQSSIASEPGDKNSYTDFSYGLGALFAVGAFSLGTIMTKDTRRKIAEQRRGSDDISV